MEYHFGRPQTPCVLFNPLFGWVSRPYHKWAGTVKAGQTGCGGPYAARRYRAGLSLRSLQFLLPAGGDKSLTEKTTAAAAAADAGVFFYQYGATGIIAFNIISNRPAPRVDSAEATGERGQNL